MKANFIVLAHYTSVPVFKNNALFLIKDHFDSLNLAPVTDIHKKLREAYFLNV